MNNSVKINKPRCFKQHDNLSSRHNEIAPYIEQPWCKILVKCQDRRHCRVVANVAVCHFSRRNVVLCLQFVFIWPKDRYWHGWKRLINWTRICCVVPMFCEFAYGTCLFTYLKIRILSGHSQFLPIKFLHINKHK